MRAKRPRQAGSHVRDDVRDEPQQGEGTGTRRSSEPGDPELRAKYIEYCSARISEVFLSLSDEQTYGLLEEGAREEGLDLAALGFQSKMRLVTRKLRDSVPLPPFDDWAAEYVAHPERFDSLLLGLWKEAMGGQEPPEGSEDA